MQSFLRPQSFSRCPGLPCAALRCALQALIPAFPLCAPLPACTVLPRQALDQERLGPERAPFGEAARRRVAVMEAATALTCTLLPAIEPVMKASSLPFCFMPSGLLASLRMPGAGLGFLRACAPPAALVLPMHDLMPSRAPC